MKASTSFGVGACPTSLHDERSKHHGHKGEPRVTAETCDGIGERARGIGTVCYLWKL